MGTIINPGATNWFVPASGITIMGTTKTYATYAAMLQDPAPGKLAWVQDATGDPSVDKGSALYSWQDVSRTWTKIYETEIMDVGQSQAIQNFLGWIATPEQLTAMYPTGQNGWYAIVGSTDTIWVWDSDTAAWKNSSSIGGVIQWNQIVDPPSSHPISFITGLQSELDNRPTSQVIESIYVKQSTLSNVATSGSYRDLKDTPDIEAITTSITNIHTSIDEQATNISAIQTALSGLSADNLPGMEVYLKKTDTIAWANISDAPDVATKDYVVQNFSAKGHVHEQYLLSSTAAETYAPKTHNHTAKDVAGVPTVVQLVCPVNSTNVYLVVNVYEDFTMHSVINTIDSRTAEGRTQLRSYNGTSFVEFPSVGLDANYAGGFTLVDLGNVDTTTMKYVHWTWVDTEGNEVISAAFGYPTLTPTDMVSVGNFWRQIPATE